MLSFPPPQPHLPADKAQAAPGSEQQHLLTTAPSSSSSSLESAASASPGGTPTRDQPGGSGEPQAGSGSSGKWLHSPLRDASWFLPSPCLLGLSSPAPQPWLALRRSTEPAGSLGSLNPQFPPTFAHVGSFARNSLPSRQA